MGLYQKRFKTIFIAIPTALIPYLSWIWIINHFYRGDFAGNFNTQHYFTILKSYLSGNYAIPQWIMQIINVPGNLIHNFFNANFFFLPIVFILFVAYGYFLKKKHRINFQPQDVFIFLSVFLVYLFINMAPPHFAQFQFGGDAFSRFYQPLLAPLFFYVLRFIDSKKIKNKKHTLFLVGTVWGLCLIQYFVVLGPYLNNPFKLSSRTYWQYYKHSAPDAMDINLKKYNQKLFNFCKPNSF
jgi:hypothetical protein